MPVDATPFRIAAGQEPSSPAQWVLVVAVVLLGVCCVLVWTAGLRFGCLGTVTAALVFPVSRFAAVSFGAGGTTAALTGALAAEIAFLASSLSLATVLGRRWQRERQAEVDDWKESRKGPRTMQEMREYWSTGD